MRALPRLTLLTLALVPVASACGSDDSGPPPAAVRGLVRYAGKKVGPLTVAVVARFPPMGAPAAFVRVASPKFPQSYQIDSVPAGTYTVFAVLDDGNDNPTAPGADDPVAPAAAQVTVSATQGAVAGEITLVDP